MLHEIRDEAFEVVVDQLGVERFDPVDHVQPRVLRHTGVFQVLRDALQHRLQPVLGEDVVLLFRRLAAEDVTDHVHELEPVARHVEPDATLAFFSGVGFQNLRELRHLQVSDAVAGVSEDFLQPFHHRFDGLRCGAEEVVAPLLAKPCAYRRSVLDVAGEAAVLHVLEEVLAALVVGRGAVAELLEQLLHPALDALEGRLVRHRHLRAVHEHLEGESGALTRCVELAQHTLVAVVGAGEPVLHHRRAGELVHFVEHALAVLAHVAEQILNAVPRLVPRRAHTVSGDGRDEDLLELCVVLARDTLAARVLHFERHLERDLALAEQPVDLRRQLVELRGASARRLDRTLPAERGVGQARAQLVCRDSGALEDAVDPLLHDRCGLRQLLAQVRCVRPSGRLGGQRRQYLLQRSIVQAVQIARRLKTRAARRQVERSRLGLGLRLGLRCGFRLEGRLRPGGFLCACFVRVEVFLVAEGRVVAQVGAGLDGSVLARGAHLVVSDSAQRLGRQLGVGALFGKRQRLRRLLRLDDVRCQLVARTRPAVDTRRPLVHILAEGLRHLVALEERHVEGVLEELPRAWIFRSDFHQPLTK